MSQKESLHEELWKKFEPTVALEWLLYMAGGLAVMVGILAGAEHGFLWVWVGLGLGLLLGWMGRVLGLAVDNRKALIRIERRLDVADEGKW